MTSWAAGRGRSMGGDFTPSLMYSTLLSSSCDCQKEKLNSDNILLQVFYKTFCLKNLLNFSLKRPGFSRVFLNPERLNNVRERVYIENRFYIANRFYKTNNTQKCSSAILISLPKKERYLHDNYNLVIPCLVIDEF